MLSRKKWIFGLLSILLAAGLLWVTRPQKCAAGICTALAPEAAAFPQIGYAAEGYERLAP